MAKAEELREGLFSISWTIQNVSTSNPSSQVVVENFHSCRLVSILPQYCGAIVLEMETTNLPDSFKRAVAWASYGGVKQLLTNKEKKSITGKNLGTFWKTSWSLNPPSVCQRCNGGLGRGNQAMAVSFEILIDVNSDAKSVKKGTKNVLEHLQKLWENKTLSDVTFKCGEQLIKAHTLILASGSPVLAAMFQNDFKESQKRMVVIKEIQANVLENLFRYIYVGECALLLENGDEDGNEVAGLLVAADKYAVDSLKEECESHLSKILSVENVAKFLVLAHLHNSPKLHETALNFMAKNGKAVCSRKDWMEIIKNYPELCFQATQLMVGL